MRRLALAALLALVASACGEAIPAAQAITIGNDVTVAITPPPDVLPFNPRAARIQVATQKLSAEAGHSIAIQIDQALLPSYRSSFEEALASAIESIATDLKELRASRLAAFQREVPRFVRLECHYDATRERADAEFVAARGVILVLLPPSDERSLVPRGFVAGALEQAFDSELESRYATLSVERVDRAHWGEYFEWATGRHPSAAERALPADQRFANDPRALAAVRVAALWRLVGGADPALARRIDGHLAQFARYLQSAYEQDAELVRGAPPDSPFRRAELAWTAWANARMSAFDPAVKLVIAEAVFHAGYVSHDYLGRARGEKQIRGRERFPGFDAFAFGMGIVDAWIAAGHPKTGDEHDARFEIARVVVCPYERDARGKLDSRRGCEGGFLRQSLDDEAQARKLADAVAQRGDAPLLESLVANVGHAYDAGHDATTFLAALFPHAREWRSAMVELVTDFDNESSIKSLLKTEAQRVWAVAPDRRGTSLYVLARLDRGYDPHYTDEWWSEFPKRYGGAIDMATLSSALDQSPRAMQVVSLMWPALGPGYSRAEAIIAHLDRFLDEPMIRDADSGDPGHTMRAILARICESGSAAELAKLHAYLVGRAAKGNASALENLIVDTAPGRCPKPKGS